jgi:cysteine synthase A
VSGAVQWLTQHRAEELTAVAIAPDLGERYLDTVYNLDWVRKTYGDEVVDRVQRRFDRRRSRRRARRAPALMSTAGERS